MRPSHSTPHSKTHRELTAFPALKPGGAPHPSAHSSLASTDHMAPLHCKAGGNAAEHTEYLMSITISAPVETHTNKHTNKDVITIAVCARKGLIADDLAKAPE